MHWKSTYPCYILPPLEIVFQEQSYSSLHSGWSFAWDHFPGVIANPCGIIGDPCSTISDYCGVIADPCDDWPSHDRRCGDWRSPLPIIPRLTKHCETLVKHHETLVEHYETQNIVNY